MPLKKLEKPLGRVDLETGSGLFFCFVWVCLIWLLLGLRGNHLLLGADGIFNLWPIMSRTSDFAFDILGGSQISEVYGRPMMLSLLASLGLSTLWALNWTVILFQTCTAYLLFACLPRKTDFSYAENLCLSFICVGLIAFLPAYGWRISRGHLNLVQGMAYLLATLSLYQMLRERKRRPRVLGLTIITLMVLNGLPSGAGQLFTYGLVFGFPLYLALFFEDRRALLYAIGMTVGGAFLVMPWLYPVVHNALHGQFSHTQNAAGNVYGYITQTAADWKQCFFWFFPLISSPREPMFQHEAYLSFGPLPFFALALFARDRRWAQLACCLVSVFLFMTFASNTSPFSDGLLRIFPVLNSFRVPLRAGLIPLLFLQFFGAVCFLRGVLNTRGDVQIWSQLLPTALTAFILVGLMPLMLRELLAWTLVFAFLHPRASSFPRIAALTMAITVGGLSVLAYQTTLWPPLTDTTAFQSKIRETQNKIQTEAPQLFSPLVRTQVELPGMGPSAAALVGLSTLNGYWFPTTGFASLTSALEGGSGPSPMQMGFYIYKDLKGFEVLRDLYNIQAVDRSGQKGLVDLEILPAGRSVWASSEQKTFDSYSDLATQLQRQDRHSTQWIPQSTEPPLNNPDCAMTTFSSLAMTSTGLSFDMVGKALCPVTIAINHMSNVRVESETGEQLKDYVADGALVGFIAPQGAHHISVRFSVVRPWWLWILSGFGLFLCATLYARLKCSHIPDED